MSPSELPESTTPASSGKPDVLPSDVLPSDVLPSDVLPSDVLSSDVLPADGLPAHILPADASAASSDSSRRILAVQAPEQWTGHVLGQDFLEIPHDMDVAAQETAWFTSGGDSSGKTFAEFLCELGASKITVEIWNINYM